MMDLHLLTPYIRIAWDSVIYPPISITERVIFDYELMYVKEGEARITIEGKVYYGKPGDLFLFQPKQRHSIVLLNNKPLHQPHIHFDLFYQPDSPDVKVSFKPLETMTESEKKWFREDVLSQMPIQLPSHIRLNHPLVIEKLLYDIIYEFESKFPFYEITAKGLFIQLWIQLLRESHWTQNAHLQTNREMLDRVKNYLSHQTSCEVSLNELSVIANISKYYLCRLFKNAFGMTPIQYHVIVRLEKAKEMIQFTDIPLTDIAERLGFQSIHAFSRVFHKNEGVAPSFYRKRK